MHHHLFLLLMAAAALTPAVAAIVQQLFAIVIPPAAGWFATEIGLLIPAINKLGAIGAGVVNVLISFLLGLGFVALGLAPVAGLSGLDSATIAAVLTALVRIAFPIAAAMKAARTRDGLQH